jgi:hypothetical protein
LALRTRVRAWSSNSAAIVLKDEMDCKQDEKEEENE